MGLHSSLNAGVMGLNVNATRLATVSDNIANASTTGYKAATADFHSIVTNQSTGLYSAGGVRVTSGRNIAEEGALTATGNSTDIAIAGRGMIPVTTVVSRDEPAADRPFYMTSTGSFNEDKDGYLRTSSGLQLLGWPTDENGAVNGVSRESPLSLEPVRIFGFDYVSNPTTEIQLGLNLPATETTSTATGDPYEMTVEYYDQLGAAQILTMTYTPTVGGATASNEWNLQITDSAQGGASVGEYTLQFTDTGASAGLLSSVTTVSGGGYNAITGEIDLVLPHGNVALEIGAPGALGHITQFGSTFSPSDVTKDGTPVGTLTRVEVTEQGFVEAVYDSGYRRPLYQIPVVDVPNFNGLTATDNQTFQISVDSGDLYLWDAGEGPSGTVLGYSLEASTSDIAEELTHLIETQRAYSSNAKIIQTVDEMMQETTNIKR
ncbi:MAG: flagellar hook-basal body complex protein [Neomegalonema sp.]|nr:flagellar hook-basal body complex protein [Neomegalonema sp.]